VLRFDAGKRIELEPNPYYWQDGVPRADALQFHLNVLPADTITGFRAGRFSLAWNLLPADAELLRLEPDFASGYHATPSLSTYMIVLNTHRGPLADAAVRQRIVHGLDVEQLVRRQAGRLAVNATGVIPPGLLGYDPTRSRQHGSGSHKARTGDPIELKCLVHSIYETMYHPLAQELFENLKSLGFKPVIVEKRSEYASITQYSETADLNLTRWIADYPDADAFAYSLLHSQKGLHGPFCGMPELDRLIEQGRVESDPGTRHELYRQFEEMIARNYSVIPLFHEQTYRFTHPGLEGFEFRHNYPTVAYEKLWIRS
jgi:peptide/nickel transport system substrate-binding protein